MKTGFTPRKPFSYLPEEVMHKMYLVQQLCRYLGKYEKSTDGYLRSISRQGVLSGMHMCGYHICKKHPSYAICFQPSECEKDKECTLIVEATNERELFEKLLSRFSEVMTSTM